MVKYKFKDSIMFSYLFVSNRNDTKFSDRQWSGQTVYTLIDCLTIPLHHLDGNICVWKSQFVQILGWLQLP